MKKKMNRASTMPKNLFQFIVCPSVVSACRRAAAKAVVLRCLPHL
jgi:hypothetical protein